ncbi:MAG: hypothetical protein V4544_05185 [Pseudomonadota bacterium]
MQVFCSLFFIIMLLSSVLKEADAHSQNSFHKKVIASLLPPELASKIDLETIDQILINPKIQQAIDILKPFDTEQFSLDQLIHHPNKKISNGATFMRQYYLYFIYSISPVIDMTGFMPTPHSAKWHD